MDVFVFKFTNFIVKCLRFFFVSVLTDGTTDTKDNNSSTSSTSSTSSHGGKTGRRKDGDRKTTRVRTVLNEKQLHTLRTCYGANPRPDALMKEQLTEMTGLSQRVIRVWFQNKRCKDKKRSILMKQLQQQQQEKVSSHHPHSVPSMAPHLAHHQHQHQHAGHYTLYGPSSLPPSSPEGVDDDYVMTELHGQSGMVGMPPHGGCGDGAALYMMHQGAVQDADSRLDHHMYDPGTDSDAGSVSPPLQLHVTHGGVHGGGLFNPTMDRPMLATWPTPPSKHLCPT